MSATIAVATALAAWGQADQSQNRAPGPSYAAYADVEHHGVPSWSPDDREEDLLAWPEAAGFLSEHLGGKGGDPAQGGKR